MLLYIFVFIVGFAVSSILFFFVRKRAGGGSQETSSGKEFEELGKMTGELAHEIKNPLSTIKINLKLAAEDLQRSGPSETTANDDPRLTRALRKIMIISKEADRLEQTLDTYLRYLDHTEPHFTTADINELLGDMIDFYSAQAYSHAITIRQGFSEQPLICKIDTDMLKQAILNLFINAQQAMGKSGELMIRTSSYQNDAVITVSDTGRGITADNLGHIFDAYYSSRPHGSGLGLPTAKKIIEAHAGSISVNSEPGKGTSFTIKLPLKTD